MKVRIINADRFMLLETIRVQGIAVPKGFITDLASIPFFLQWLISRIHKTTNTAALLHDYIYQTREIKITRKEADTLFLQEMNSQNTPGWKSFLMFWGVRLFGWTKYKKRDFS